MYIDTNFFDVQIHRTLNSDIARVLFYKSTMSVNKKSELPVQAVTIVNKEGDENNCVTVGDGLLEISKPMEEHNLPSK